MQRNTIKNFQYVYEEVKKRCAKLTISVIFPHYIEIIKAIKKAADENLCKFALFGDARLINDLLKELKVTAGIVDVFNFEDERTACEEGIKLIKKGKSHILMKGDIKTSTILKSVLDKDKGLRTGKFLSHIFVAEVPHYHKFIVVSDGGLSISPTLTEKIFIIQNAVEFVHCMGIKIPKVALLCASEVVNPDMVETIDAHNIINMYNDKILEINAILEGPIALDIAVSTEAARIKKINSQIAGDTDIFIVPNIASGNIFGKALIYFANAKAGGLIWGAKVPVVLLSRADDYETKFRSLLLGLLASAYNNEHSSLKTA